MNIQSGCIREQHPKSCGRFSVIGERLAERCEVPESFQWLIIRCQSLTGKRSNGTSNTDPPVAALDQTHPLRLLSHLPNRGSRAPLYRGTNS